MDNGPTLAIGYPLTPQARDYVAQTEYVRQRERTCTDQELVTLLKNHGLPVTAELLDFERNLGGWTYPGSINGMGIFLCLQDGEGATDIPKVFSETPLIFGPAEPDEDGVIAPIHGTGYPRAYFEERPLVPAGMWGEDSLAFIGTGGEIYAFVVPNNELYLMGASGRTYLEQETLRVRCWGQSWYEVHLLADVAEVVADMLGLPRFEPACDRLFDVWADERAHVRLVRDVSPNVFGTHVAVNSEEGLVNVIRRVRQVHPDVRVSACQYNGMQGTWGYTSLKRAGVVQ